MTGRQQYQRLQALLAVKRWDDVISMATTAIAGDPNDARLYATLASAQLGAGQPSEALKAADNAARLEPEWGWAHRLRARSFERLGQRTSALAAAQEAVRLEPEDSGALQVLASQQLALKRWVDAERTAAEMIRISPEWAESFNTRGRLFLGRRKFDQAESDFRAALRLAPDEPAYTNNLGAALQGRGKRKEAIEAFRNAATTDPNFDPARKNLFASTSRYLWGGAAVVVLSVLFRIVVFGSFGQSNSGVQVLLVVIILLAVVGPVVLVLYWLRKRSLNPVVQTFYEAETRRARRRTNGQTMVWAGGFLLLLGVFVAALLANQVRLGGLCAVLALLWLYRGPALWRYASRWFSR